MAQQPTYILAPNFHFKSGTGPIALGNIISNPLQPHRALTTVDTATLDTTYPKVERFTDYERSITRGDHRGISISVWAEFLQTVSGKVSGGRGSDVQSSYTMESLETMYFVTDPPIEEIQARLKAPRIQAVTRASRIPGFRSPVYMVTGLMIAKGLSATMENNKSRDREFELSGNAPSPAGQVGAGANIAKSTSTERADQWRASEDIVFAYQLLKIEIKGWKGNRVEYDELRHKAAYLSKDDDEESEEEEDEEEEVLISPANAATLPRSNGTTGVTVTEVEEDGDRVSCISSMEK